MKYRESHKDKQLRSWFASDMTRGILRRIFLKNGVLRGLNSLDITFEYPITAIAGKNGAGKSTILALACCAFHNTDNGFKLPKRRNSYYTFSDFFIQNSAETSPQGLEIYYSFAYNNWKKGPTVPEGIGIGGQLRKKTKGGKWNDYDRRVKRNVVFLGIERIVPHSERSQSRSYSKVFKDTKPKGWEPKVREAVGHILGKTYLDFRYLEHSKYSLPIVKCKDVVYSGFNMGAGENALFEIFSTLYAAGDGALLVMDEIELGLHAEAQKRFIDRLKDVCLETHTQVICTTHSKEIFDCLPNDARFYVESVNNKTRVTQGISSDFAFAKMSATTGTELDIYVEDEVAKSILMTSLPSSIRARSTFTVIGSATALARQLAALYVRGETRPALAIFDGDQRIKEADNLNHARKMAEKVKADFDAWFANHICYLPGDTWPEAWLLQKATTVLDPLSAVVGNTADELAEIIEYGLQAGKHCDFFEMSKHLGLDQHQCLQHFTTVVHQMFAADLLPVSTKIGDILAAND
ncbi:MAG: AAA family ATPase [Polaromonas sp.]|nr:AAA family ATPase [Polaromonas sp.]